MIVIKPYLLAEQRQTVCKPHDPVALFILSRNCCVIYNFDSNLFRGNELFLFFFFFCKIPLDSLEQMPIQKRYFLLLIQVG